MSPSCSHGGVSNVDIDGNNTLQIKAIGVFISTFETLPSQDLRGYFLGDNYALPHSIVQILRPFSSVRLLRKYLLLDNPEPGVSDVNEGLGDCEKVGKEGIGISSGSVFLTPVHHLSIDTPGDRVF